MTFTFIVATQKKRGEPLPLLDFLSQVDLPDSDTKVECDIEYENKEGLSKVYNKLTSNHLDSDFICYLHDDFTPNDYKFFDKIVESKFDVIGNVGGLQYRVPQDWRTRPFLWTEACEGKASGFVLHKHPTHDGLYLPSSFGVAPLPCVWLDGQCLVLNRRAIESCLTFDEDFDFDHYDGSLCMRARQMGLSVGTAPILATHESCGQGMMAHKERYMKSQIRFIEKFFLKSA